MNQNTIDRNFPKSEAESVGVEIARVKNVTPLSETDRITAMAQTIEFSAVKRTFIEVVEVLNNDNFEGTKNIRTVKIFKDFVGAYVLFRNVLHKTTLNKLLEIPQVGWVDLQDGYLSLKISGSHGHKEEQD